MKRKALYAGSFDPITKGHIDVIERALLIFDEIVIGVGMNVDKPGLFNAKERIALIEGSLKVGKNVTVASYVGLTADFARKSGCSHLVRGLRDGYDFSFEMRAALMNRHLEPNLETVFIPTSAEFSNVSSSLIKEVGSLGGNISQFLPPNVSKALKLKYRQKAKA